MKIDIPYGKSGKHTVEVSDDINVSFLEANDVDIQDEKETINQALANPNNSKSFKDFVKDAKNVLIIVNDATRPTPTEKVVESIYDDLKKVNFNFIIATGAHRGPTEEEYNQIFGAFYPKIKNNIIVHDAKKSEEMVYLGDSNNGTPMYVHKSSADADRIIIISSVEPHYFAGYTGGRKSFLPGIAGYDTIEANHKLALNPAAKSLALDGNPVNEDMIDAIKTVKQDIFSIMTVLDKNHKIYATTAGHIHDSFFEAVDKANEVFAAPLKEKADIVVSVVKFPQDINLYQAQKGIDNAKLALKEDGIMILIAQCRDSIGSDTFADLLRSCDTPKDTLDKIKETYVLGYHKAGKIAEIAEWAQIWAVSDIDPELLPGLFITPIDSIQNAVDKALEEKGQDSSVLFLMDGGLTVPMV
ncbi:MAG: nickel-dependent lactate racemase [Desulfobacteraceae bacterium]|nr:nickel-dependent lactate racemase [Desulfobacteraceae bacterium]